MVCDGSLRDVSVQAIIAPWHTGKLVSGQVKNCSRVSHHWLLIYKQGPLLRWWPLEPYPANRIWRFFSGFENPSLLTGSDNHASLIYSWDPHLCQVHTFRCSCRTHLHHAPVCYTASSENFPWLQQVLMQVWCVNTGTLLCANKYTIKVGSSLCNL